MVILYDDSDGWYDHQMGPIVTQSQTPLDALTGTGMCGTNTAKVPDAAQQARCGVGPRQPLLVISPYSKQQLRRRHVHRRSPRWSASSRTTGSAASGSAAAPTTPGPGRSTNMFDFSKPNDPPLFLDPSTGEPTSEGAAEH